MATIEYPSTLPRPQKAPLRPAERRHLSEGRGPFNTRNKQRDWLATQEFEFLFTAAQVAIFYDWWENDLAYGGAWFAAYDWPSPQGFVGGTYRLLGVPTFEHVAVGVQRVRMQCQIRGRGVPPEGLAGLFYGPLILLRFDTAVGSQVFLDEGYGQAIWTASGAGVVISDTQSIAGNALRIPDADSTLSAEYNSNIALLGEDFEIQFDVRPDAGALDGKDWFGIVDASGETAAWAFYTGLSGGLFPNKMSFFWHDQNDVEYRISSNINTPASVWTRFKAKRAGTDITLQQDGVVVASYSNFTGSIRDVANLDLNLGKVIASEQGTGTKACYFDNVIVVRGPGSVDDFLTDGTAEEPPPDVPPVPEVSPTGGGGGGGGDTPRVFGLDYMTDFSSTSVALLSKFPWVLRGISIGRAQSSGVSYVNALRAINPDLEFGVYVALNELRDPLTSSHDAYPLWQAVNANDWWVYKELGHTKVQWTTDYSNFELNMTRSAPADSNGRRLSQWKASQFDFPRKLDYVPGADWLFIDNFWRQPRVTADYNRDLVNDTPANVGSLWRQGFMDYVDTLKSERPGLKIIANANHTMSDPEYVGLIEAAFDEGTIGKSYGKFANGGIEAVRTRMLALIQNTADGRAILNAYGESNDYQKMRFGLTMAMLFDAWYAYIDDTPDLHAVWFDEFEQIVGSRTDAIPSAAWSNGVWACRYESALVLCNPTSTAQTVNPTTLGTYTRFSGAQAPSVNSGAAVAGAITIQSQDGILLLAV